MLFRYISQAGRDKVINFEQLLLQLARPIDDASSPYSCTYSLLLEARFMPPSRFSITRRLFEEETEDLWAWNTKDLLGIDKEKSGKIPLNFFQQFREETLYRGYSFKSEQFLSLFFRIAIISRQTRERIELVISSVTI